ncbi:hypothetical protein E0Z10_g10702 [Xylaria hypoxylon]|uniref:non-specific serine/threonine protein kinase n=1 Tax=Xylaria hypoxylon TaxID=37992 RepID=A0A4Z0Y116_9PEZI|nr:hypothetical protein E0Z10_g10702 [Xylaria hypoxylon]
MATPTHDQTHRLCRQFKDWVHRNVEEGIEGNGEEAHYISYSKLKEYWTHNRIATILGPYDMDVDIWAIKSRFIQVISILTYITDDSHKWAKYLENFYKSDTDDHALPLHIPNPDTNSTSTAMLRRTPIPFCADSDYQVWLHFSDHQWKFLPLHFKPNEGIIDRVHSSRALNPRHIIPITIEKELSQRSGRGVRVLKVKPHEASGLPPEHIVLKEYNRIGYFAQFMKERDANITIRSIHNSAIDVSKYFLRYHGCFVQGDKCILLIEYANHGSLLEFFDRNWYLPHTKEEAQNLWSDLGHLIKGLALLHNGGKYNSVISQDIKPANIFVSETGSNRNRFSIRFGNSGTCSVTPIANNGDTTGHDNGETKIYSAPELCYIDSEVYMAEPVSWQADIWSFGCVLLDCGVWMIMGERGRIDFWGERIEEIHHLKQDSLIKAGYAGAFHDGEQVLSTIKKKTEEIFRLNNPVAQLVGHMMEFIQKEVLRTDIVERLTAQQLQGNFQEAINGLLTIHSPLNSSSSSMYQRPISPPIKTQTGLAFDTIVQMVRPTSRNSVTWFDQVKTTMGMDVIRPTSPETSPINYTQNNPPSNQPATDSGYASKSKSLGGNLSLRQLDALNDGSGFGSTSAGNSQYHNSNSQFSQHFGLYTAPTTYSNSANSTLLPARDRGFVDYVAEELFNTVKYCDKVTLERVSQVLPDLLRAFALKLGSSEQGRIHRDISFFVHKYRSGIHDSFDSLFPLEDNAKFNDNGQFALDRFLSEKDEQPDNISIFDTTLGEEYGDDQEDDNKDEKEEYDDGDDDDDDDMHKLEIGLYRNSVLSTPAYQWLIGNLLRESKLTRGDPDIMENIRANILQNLPSLHKVSRSTPIQKYRGIFELQWDPLSFIREQGYTGDLGVVLGKIITLTGSDRDAQAITTREYLSQTWPTTGEAILQLPRQNKALISEISKVELLDGTYMESRIDGSRFVITAVGTGDSIAEVGQQSAWLGAALRSSNFEDGVASCTPTVFSEPIMVSGYPILTRQERGLGLEMPLQMMGALVGSKRVETFEGNLFIKGFSTMLVPAKLTEDIIVWHYHFNAERKKISYFDHTLATVDSLTLVDLENTRHVVGWCLKSTHHAGAHDAQYDVIGSGLPPPHGDCLLDKATISGGNGVVGGVSFLLGVKDVPLHVTLDGYVPNISSMGENYVVFWDEKDKRGWLVNGTSALLHIVRAALRFYGTGPAAGQLLFDPDKMNNPDQYSPESAFSILTNNDNRQLKVFSDRCERFEEGNDHRESELEPKKKVEFYLFEDLVDDRCRMLDQVMIKYDRLAGRNGINLKLRVRKHLEGWDFVDLARGRKLFPRVATLQAVGYGWVDFIRTIGAISLFGREFGDIIKPEEPEIMCPKWITLPTGSYYLATSLFDARNITDRFGDQWSHPPKLIHGLTAYCPGRTLAHCHKRDEMSRIQRLLGASNRHKDPVNVFYPERYSQIVGSQSLDWASLGSRSALVFGHNVVWPYRWRDDSDVLDKHASSLTHSIDQEGDDIESNSANPSQQPASSISSGQPPGSINIEHDSPSPSSLLSAFQSVSRLTGRASRPIQIQQEGQHSNHSLDSMSLENGASTRRVRGRAAKDLIRDILARKG